MPKRTFALYLYRTRDFLITLGGLILLGSAALLILNSVLPLSNWMQYALLTAWITGAYFAAGCFAAKPAQVQVSEEAILIAPDKHKPKSIPWKTIKSYAYYEELTLFSLKIALLDGEILSVIQFKWREQTDFQAFLAGFEMLAGANREIEKAKTFYNSHIKVVLSLTLLILYIAISAILITRNSFSGWPAVSIYFYWVIPILFFLKMWKAK